MPEQSEVEWTSECTLEWKCPNCGKDNQEISYDVIFISFDEVICFYCQSKFLLD